MSLPVGAHVPNQHPLQEAGDRKADLLQMFLSDPQSWRKPSPRDDAEELRMARIPIYVHAPYLINVAAAESRIRIPSRRILQETCDAAAEIGAKAVIVHGGHLTGEGDLMDTLPRWRKALTQLDSGVQVLIENSAGGENAVVRRVENLAALWGEIGDLGPGLALDTCHAWAGGEPFEGLVERVKEATGRIDLIHCNDSRDPFDSRRDRHALLGRGEIPPDLLAMVLREADAPVVVETPGGASEHAADIAWVRSHIDVTT
jgi:deoxyribonuclease-4